MSEKDYKSYQEEKEIFKVAIESIISGDLLQFKNTIKTLLDKNQPLTLSELWINFHTEGKGFLHFAASSGKQEIVDYILNSFDLTTKSNILKELVDKQDQNGFTSLIYATISESHEIMGKLLKIGADVNIRTKDGASAIHYAAGDGSILRMKLLLQAGARLDFLSESGTPLHWAAGKGHVEAVQFLLENQVDVNIKNANGLNAVLMAAVTGSDESVSKLVDAGSDVGLLLSGNLTVLHICSEHGMLKSIESILRSEVGRKCCDIETNDGNKPIHLAAMSKDKQAIELLIPFTSNLPSNFAISEELIDHLLFDGELRLKQWNEKNDPNHVQPPQPPTTSETKEPSDEDKKKAEYHKELGNQHFKRKDYSSAVDEYTLAIQWNGHDASYWSNRSACYYAMKDYEKALLDAETCRRLRPTWSKGCYRLAVARLALNQFEDAAVTAFEGCKLDETNKELKELLQLAVKKGQEEYKLKNSTSK